MRFKFEMSLALGSFEAVGAPRNDRAEYFDPPAKKSDSNVIHLG
jgi:hypothetical protein